ncbi:MAG: gluconokinase [Bryobacter sp.]|nr:gluconokinase [Bryobacter sp.]
MVKPLVVSFDAGTTSVKTLVFDEQARALDAQPSVPYELHTSVDGGVEIPIENIFGATLKSLDAAHAALAAAGHQPLAVSLTTFWHSFLGIDERGQPTTPILHLLDTRSEPYALRLKQDLDEASFHRRVGVVFHPSYWPAKLLWIKEHRPDWWKNTHRWLSYGEYLLGEFLGQAAAATSMLSATGIWDSSAQSYDTELLQYLEIPVQKLAHLEYIDQPVQGLREEYAKRWPLFREIPWFPAIGDGAANNIGCGCDEPREFALMVGTTGAMRVVFETPQLETPEGLWRYRLDPRRFVVGGALSNGGKVFEWITERFRMEPDWPQQLATMEPGAHGLTMLPLFAGERSTKWRADARGAIVGLNLNTTPVEILAAGLEAVALRFRLIYDILAARVGAPERVVATGEALRRSAVWTQMMADALGRPVVASLEKETSARGAAMLALERLGVVNHLRDFSSALGETYQPRAQYAGVYARLLEEQKSLYRRLLETP